MSRGALFRLRSLHATAVRLVLFNGPGATTPSSEIELAADSNGQWSRHVEDVGTGQLYGFRVEGPWDPPAGHWFNPAKLLLDPAALATTGTLTWDSTLAASDPESDFTLPNFENSAASVPLSVVADREFDWQGVAAPRRSWEETVIYECHVKGLTQLHPEVPAGLRGTYTALAHESVVEHLRSLGVTAVELLPVQQHLSEHHLVRAGLTNYFGYNPIAWFAPHESYASSPGNQVGEFKTMVRELHRHGLEVILDVVFNHTAEGDHRGPTLSLRGIDNSSYYRLSSDRRDRYENYSGCGNTLDFSSPLVVDLALDCLRYWVEEMHVDGFRFDLATVLGRSGSGFESTSPFLSRVCEDEVISRAKLIAEPWDLGPRGYRLGGFPTPWSEWNDRFRDAGRRFWRGETTAARELGVRMLGSPDIFPPGERSARASINFVTSHDGFTLEDLVSYERKHNEANGEANNDGHHHNLSCNWGHEGPTESPEILAHRSLAKRNLIATLLLADGVPMLSHGDELGRSQRGNNNAYCQDSELTWVDWQSAGRDDELLAFVREMVRLRSEVVLVPDASDPAIGVDLIAAHGDPARPSDWAVGSPSIFGILRYQPPIASLVILNNDRRARLFKLPGGQHGGDWWRLLSTATPGAGPVRGRSVRVVANSMMVLRQS